MPAKANHIQMRWIVCGLLFLITTVNYIDRSALALVEPLLKPLLGGDQDASLYNRHYSQIVTCFIVAYGLGFLVMGRVIDRIGARLGLAVSIATWALASISHAFARSVPAFGLARFALGLGDPDGAQLALALGRGLGEPLALAGEAFADGGEVAHQSSTSQSMPRSKPRRALAARAHSAERRSMRVARLRSPRLISR